jgi:hypothetical protein
MLGARGLYGHAVSSSIARYSCTSNGADGVPAIHALLADRRETDIANLVAEVLNERERAVQILANAPDPTVRRGSWEIHGTNAGPASFARDG